MTRPKFPPKDEWMVHVPASILLDRQIPDTAKVTWAQLRWMAWGGTETPPFTAQEFEAETGTKEKTLYGHLRILRDRHASRWHRGNGATFIVAFDCQEPGSDPPPQFLEIENSGNPDNPIILDQADRSEELKEVSVSGNREFSKSRKQESRVLFEAVADVTGRTPRERKWTSMANVVRGILNKVVGELERMEATPDMVYKFGPWFDDLKKLDYRYRGRKKPDPWDIVKLWPIYIGDQNGLRQHDNQTQAGTGSGAEASGVAARVQAIQRAAAERAGQGMPPLRSASSADSD